MIVLAEVSSNYKVKDRFPLVSSDLFETIIDFDKRTEPNWIRKKSLSNYSQSSLDKKIAKFLQASNRKYIVNHRFLSLYSIWYVYR